MFFKYLLQAYKGKFFQRKLEKKYGDGLYPSRYILFPSEDNEYNAWGIYFLSYYIEKNHFDRVIVLASDEKILTALKNLNLVNFHILNIKKTKMDCLIRLAGLVKLESKWTIVSVKEPYDTDAEHLLGKKGITKKEIVWYDIYKMSVKPETIQFSDTKNWNIAEEFSQFYQQR